VSKQVWCVGWYSRDEHNPYSGNTSVEWCAAADQSEQPRGGDSVVETACSRYVHLPVGVEFRDPTCPECLAK
jgi:hypothetical protein